MELSIAPEFVHFMPICVGLGILLILVVSNWRNISCDIPKTFHNDLEAALFSNEVYTSAVALIVSACPMTLDVVIDICAQSKLVSKKTKKCFIARAVNAITTMMFGILLVSKCSLYIDFATTFWLFFRLYRTITFSCYLYCLCIANPAIFSVRSTNFLTIVATFISISRCLATAGIMHFIQELVTLWFVSFLILYISWVYQMWQRRNNFIVDDYASVYYLCVVAVQILALFVNSIIVTNGIKYYMQQYQTFNITREIYLQSAGFVLMAIIPGRIARMEAISFKDKVLETKQNYVRYISHEMRTPLNVVFMGLDHLTGLIPEGNPVDAEKRSTLMEVFCACEESLSILNDLLQYDKLKSGLVNLLKEKVYVYDFLSNTINMFTAQLRSKKLRLRFDTGILNHSDDIKDLCIDDKVDADRSKLTQVMRNLLSNAIKFTPEGGDILVSARFVPCIKTDKQRFTNSFVNGLWGRCLSVYTLVSTFLTSKSPEGSPDDKHIVNEEIVDQAASPSVVDSTRGMLVIEVKDSGAGIKLEDQQRLFKEIVQFRPEVLQSGGGSGLGLFITKGLVDLHEGGISVHSEGEGKGTTFRLELPMQRMLSTHGKGDGIGTGSSSSSSSSTLPSSLQTDWNFQESESLDKSCAHGSNTRAPIILSSVNSPINAKKKANITGGGHSEEMQRNQRQFRLLVVDDSLTTRKMSCKMLEARGHICDEAEDGLAAVAMVQSSMKTSAPKRRKSKTSLSESESSSSVVKYDAILMDYIMPKMNGPEATTAIRKLGFKGQIIGITGNVMNRDYETFMTAGASHVLTKPVDISSIVDILQSNFVCT